MSITETFVATPSSADSDRQASRVGSGDGNGGGGVIALNGEKCPHDIGRGAAGAPGPTPGPAAAPVRTAEVWAAAWAAAAACLIEAALAHTIGQFAVAAAATAATAAVAHGTARAWVERGRNEEHGGWSTDRKAFTAVGLGVAAYLVAAPLAAVTVNVALGGSVGWEGAAAWVLRLDHRTPRHAARCGDAVCYDGGVDAEGARQLEAATDGVAPGTELRIRSPGGDMDAMEDIVRTVARHAMPVAVAVDPTRRPTADRPASGSSRRTRAARRRPARG